MIGYIFSIHAYINIYVYVHTVCVLGLMGEKIENTKNQRKPIKNLSFLKPNPSLFNRFLREGGLA